MIGKQKIYSQLFPKKKEVELSKVEVDLGVAQDIKQLSQEAEAEYERGENEKKSIKQIAGDAISSYKQARVKANQAVKAFEKFEKSAKDLGLDVPRGVQAMVDDARNVITEGEAEIKKLQQFR